MNFLYKHIIKIAIVISIPLMLAFFTSKVYAEDIEEVVVIGQSILEKEVDPFTTTQTIKVVLPSFIWPAGGYGAFIGYRERGAQTMHTTVFQNGIPVNGAGSGWYDFGHDIASGQNVKVVSGANSVMYGSGSVAGTVMMTDTIDSSLTWKAGADQKRYISLAPTNWIQFTDFSVDQDSVRNDNLEKDTYKNQSAKIIIDAGDFKIYANTVDYAYDYDNCFDNEGISSNDCLQDGERYTISVRNEYFTIGRTEEKGEYFTDGVSTYSNESSRDYFRIGDTTGLSKLLQVTYGVDGSRDQYGEHEEDNYGAYFSVNAEFALKYNFGIRIGNADQNALRLGIEKDQFFLNVGTSYRRANLYERFGDEFVDGNDDLLPEEGIGYELGFGALSIFKYEFEEAIEYADGFNTEITTADETTENVWTKPTYYNSGSYSTQGIRFSNAWGPVSFTFKYTDSDQPRVPEYITILSWNQTFNDVNIALKYKGLFDRTPGPYDILAEGNEFLDDLQKLDFYVGKDFDNNFRLLFKIENITDEEAEVLPFYNNEGREIELALQYNW